MFDLDNQETDLVAIMAKERADVASQSNITTELLTNSNQTVLGALKSYEDETAKTSLAAQQSLSQLVTNVEQYDRLENAGPVDSIVNFFKGIIDPAYNQEKVATRIQQNERQLKLAETGRQLAGVGLDVVKEKARVVNTSASTELQQQMLELDLARGAVGDQRNAEQDKRIKENDARIAKQDFLQTKSLGELDGAMKEKYLTPQQVKEEKERRTGQAMQMRITANAVKQGDMSVYEYSRMQLLDKMGGKELQQMQESAVKNGGVWTKGGITFTLPELNKKVMDADVASASYANNFAVAEAAKATSAINVSTTARLLGGGANATWGTLSNRTDILTPAAQQAMKEADSIQRVLDNPNTTSGTAAVLAPEMVKKLESINTYLHGAVTNSFPGTVSKIAVQEFMDTGKIQDLTGGRNMFLTAAASSLSTGSDVLDAAYSIARSDSTVMGMLQHADNPTIISNSQESFKKVRNQQANMIETRNTERTLIRMASDPKYASLGIGEALANKENGLSTKGVFRMKNVDAFMEALKTTDKISLFRQGFADYSGPVAAETFTPSATTPAGAAAIAALSQQLYGGNPVNVYRNNINSRLSKNATKLARGESLSGTTDGLGAELTNAAIGALSQPFVLYK